MNSKSSCIIEELKQQNSLFEKILWLLIELEKSQSIENKHLTVASLASVIKKFEATVRRWIKPEILRRVIKVNNSYHISQQSL